MLIPTGASGSASAGFDTTLIGNSVWLDGSADFLKRDNFALSADGRKEFIFSIWVQRNEFGRAQTQFDIYPTGSTSYNDGSRFIFQAGDQLQFSVGGGGSSGGQKVSSAKYRDIGWYHVLISYNTNTSVTAASRHRLFVNGLEITDIGTYTAPPANQSCLGSGTGNADLRIGRTEHPAIPYPPKAYYAQACYLEGKSFQAGDYAITDFLDSFAFGSNGSQFGPKANADIAALASTVGGNSFCLDFADSGGTDAANLGNDISDNNNDLTPTSMAAANQKTNTPSKVYPTFNPLTQVGTSKGTFSEGNTKVSLASDNGAIVTTTLPSSGMWYWEIDWSSGANGIYPGIALQSAIGNTASSPHTRSDTFVWLAGDSSGRAYNGSSLVSYVGSATSTGRIAVAFDADNTAMYFGTVSGSTITWLASGDPTSGSSKTGAAPFTLPTDQTLYLFHSTGSASIAQYLFDEDDWTGVTNRPADAKSLNSENLTAPTYQGIDYFKPVLYTGNGTAIGSGGKAVTGVGWKPDEVWIKNRDATDDHALYDIVRGVTKQLESNTATAESTESEGLTTFGSDGFTVGSLAQVNTNTEDYVSWNWLGSNSTSTTSPAGTIASTSSVASAGHFSVGTYTGQTAAGTVGHGLGGVAEMVIVWDKGADNSIAVYHYGVASDAATDYLLLNQIDAATDNATFWNDTAPTSSVFSVGTGNNTNGNGRSKSFLAFRSVPGVCKVGSYTGNANANGPYINTGFKPAFVLGRSVGIERWVMHDTARSPINVSSAILTAETASSEATLGTTGSIDILSDGFKVRDTDTRMNGNGVTYIYLAMADIGGNGTLPPVYGR